MPIRDEITSTTVVHEVEFTAEEIEKPYKKCTAFQSMQKLKSLFRVVEIILV